MKVSQLITELQKLNPDQDVVICSGQWYRDGDAVVFVDDLDWQHITCVDDGGPDHPETHGQASSIWFAHPRKEVDKPTQRRFANQPN